MTDARRLSLALTLAALACLVAVVEWPAVDLSRCISTAELVRTRCP
jgi:hypothetical protein